MDTVIGDTAYRFQRDENLVSFTDPVVDPLVTVAGSCHIAAKIGDLFNV